MDGYIDLIQRFFQNKYFIATAIPFTLIFVMAPIRKLTRGTKGYKPSDFYLGIDLALAALTTDLIYISEGLMQNNAHQTPTVNFVAALCFAAVVLLLMLFIMSFHQDWESEDARPKSRFIRLTIISNFLGAGLLLAFILFIKGV